MKEKRSNQLSSAKIILMGELMVNLPAMTIILLSVYIMESFGIDRRISAFIGAGIGWFFWYKLLDRWKNWAFKHDVDPERLFRLGKLGLINFSRNRIIDDKSNKGRKK